MKQLIQILLCVTMLLGYTMASAKPTIYNSTNNLLSNSSSSLPTLTWTKQVGAAPNGNAEGHGISTDNSGNIYVTGQTDGGLSGQTQNGSVDYFIAKYDVTDKLIWSKQVGASGGKTYGKRISTDNYGNVYVSGWTTKGISGQIQNGRDDYFIASYNATSGNLQWTKQVGAPNGTTQGYGTSTDNSGNIYITGITNVGISGQNQNGRYDYFIAKYGISGNLIWSKQVGTSGGFTYGYGISTDNFGNIYVTGRTNRGISGQRQNGAYDYFIAKYDTNGNLAWTRQVGATGGVTYGVGVSTNGSSNIYVIGWTTVGISGQTQNGYRDYFIAKYESAGNLIWSKQVGVTGGSTYGFGISADNLGNIYVTGDTNKGLSGQTQNGVVDYFIAKYNSIGTLVDTVQVGATNGITYGYGISADNSGNIYVTGSTNVGISGQKQNGSHDYFIAKYGNYSNAFWSKQVGNPNGDTRGKGVSIDESGNIYVTGYTNKGLSGQTQNGSNDYFLTRYDMSGNLLWSKQVGNTNESTQGKGVSTDESGNIYVTGWTNGGISGQTQKGLFDYFIAKYDNLGNQIWTRQVGAGETVGAGISSSKSGNIYVTGSTTQGVSGQIQRGLSDYFIASYDKNGRLLWLRQLGNTNAETHGNAVSADNLGNIYVTGDTTKGLSGQTQNGFEDYFIAKYNVFGNLLWLKQVGASGGSTYGNGISADESGNIYVTGSTSVGISGQIQNGLTDYFIAKYDPTGRLLWTKQVGAMGGATFGTGIKADNNGNVYVIGSTDKGLFGQIQVGTADYFVVKYDSLGNVGGTLQVGATGGSALGYGISADNSGNIYVTGDTDMGLFGQSQNGINDYFIARYNN